MVKKLLKHEFAYYYRTFGLFLPIVLVIGIMTRVVQLFDNGQDINDIIIASSEFMLSISCTALLILAAVIGVVRFYKNMYSAEGYLTFTLPVTNGAHIFVKLVAAVSFQAVCLVVILLANTIANLGPEMLAFWEDFFRGFADLSAKEIFDIIFLCLEFLLAVVAAAAVHMLLYYACITIGQTAKKNRIIKAILAYFIWYIITQAVATTAMIVLMVLSGTGALDSLMEWFSEDLMRTLHTLLWFGIGFSGVLGGVFWYVTQKIMTEKLNLE